MTYIEFILVSISGILVVVYSTVTDDVGGAFGMAAFLSDVRFWAWLCCN